MTSEVKFGFIAGLIAFSIWGFLPIYIRALDGVGPLELWAHRIIWSVPTALILITVAARWADVKVALLSRNAGWLLLSGVLVGSNWLIYIYAVSIERTLEAAIGYYMNPLVNVLFGMLFFAERLRIAQWISVGIAAMGVVVATVAYGQVPYLALALCITFALYSLIRKKVVVDSRAGFMIEVLGLLPLAVGWMIWFQFQPGGRVTGGGGMTLPLLMLAGPFTATPLILFALAAKRLRLSTLGMMQYTAPTLQLLIGVFVFRETFTPIHAAAFGCIWLALLIFTTDSMMGDAKAKRLARAAQLT